MFSFEGRIGRAQWWGLSILADVLILLGALVALEVPILFIPFIPASIWLSCAITTRRLHDVGWSGKWNFISLVPYVGSLFLLIVCGFVSGQAYPNKYGYPDGYEPRHVAPAQFPSLKIHDAAPQYLQPRAEVHPSLREANDLAWASMRQEYRP